MATAVNKFAKRLRKPLRALGFGVAAATTDGDANVATITSGTGVPATSEPDGSVFLRTDGGSGTTFYVRENGAWVAK